MRANLSEESTRIIFFCFVLLLPFLVGVTVSNSMSQKRKRSEVRQTPKRLRAADPRRETLSLFLPWVIVELIDRLGKRPRDKYVFSAESNRVLLYELDKHKFHVFRTHIGNLPDTTNNSLCFDADTRCVQRLRNNGWRESDHFDVSRDTVRLAKCTRTFRGTSWVHSTQAEPLLLDRTRKLLEGSSGRCWGPIQDIPTDDSNMLIALFDEHLPRLVTVPLRENEKAAWDAENGLVYVLASPNFARYHVFTGIWEHLPPLEFEGVQCIVMANSLLYVFSLGEFVAQVGTFNPTTSEWRPIYGEEKSDVIFGQHAVAIPSFD
jgi:hypothetical protein